MNYFWYSPARYCLNRSFIFSSAPKSSSFINLGVTAFDVLDSVLPSYIVTEMIKWLAGITLEMIMHHTFLTLFSTTYEQLCHMVCGSFSLSISYIMGIIM